ncbi:hypothetical protein GA0070564_10767 [Micromonospora mirobrigensis]|uniref:MmyB-like transcription regulator ligand binding domain-containing protein n=1 Tax=Micromonospora mirobrigensis TaxID=262898 RepID=A0A1C4ZZS4_9ACTN|nr:hypothetical protein GA0070564_10767 [Micromonospora mirobrigensis]
MIALLRQGWQRRHSAQARADNFPTPDPPAPAVPPPAAPPEALSSSVLTLLYGHEPFLAWVMGPDWELLASNHMLDALVGPVDPELLAPPVNVLRLILHPRGMAPRLDNLDEVHTHLLRRLRRQVELIGGEPLRRLEREVRGYRTVPEPAPLATNPIAVPVRLRVGSTVLNLISTAVFFGTPWEGTPSGVTAECVFPADEATRRYLFADPTERPPPD